MTKSQAAKRAQQLREQEGFDKSHVDEDDPAYIKVGCSQCEALVISGVACHEQGCPNRPRKHYD